MDVGTKNFDDILPNILKDIKSAHFISIDTEFTGLLTDDAFKRSYFDSGSALYEKEMKNLENVSICQIGISVFKGLMDRNSYSASTYNIYIRPRSILSVDDNILWQVSSLEFLKEAQFDYIKWVEEGVPCLRNDQEIEVRTIFSQFLAGDLGRYYMPREVSEAVNNIKKWMEEKEEGETSTKLQFSNNSFVLFFFAKVLSSNINNINVTYLGNNKVCVSIVNIADKEEIKTEALRTLDLMLDHLKGFVKIFDAISKVKVPVIFHNGILDILLIYKQFYENLPERFVTFCQKTHELFPVVYDTKQLAFILGLKLKDSQAENEEVKPERFFGDTTLKNVKKDTMKIKGILYKPSVQHSALTPKYNDGIDHDHEAGYDAFITGFCYLHLSHIYAMSQLESYKFQRPLSPRELLHAMQQWKNEIPVQKAGVKFLALDGRAVRLKKKMWIVVEARNPFRTVSPEFVASSLRTLGALDIIQRNKRSVMIAAPKNSVAKDILRVFSDDKSFTVSRYSPIRHSVLIRSLAWSCALFSTGASTWCLMKTFAML